MSLEVVVVMDGPDTGAPATDTSFGLVVAAVERGLRRDLDVVRWLEDHAAVSDRTVSREFADG